MKSSCIYDLFLDMAAKEEHIEDTGKEETTPISNDAEPDEELSALLNSETSFLYQIHSVSDFQKLYKLLIYDLSDRIIYLYFPPSSHLVYLCFCPVGLSLL